MKEYFDDYYNDNECTIGNFKYPIDGGRRSIYELLTLKKIKRFKLNWKIQFKRASRKL